MRRTTIYTAVALTAFVLAATSTQAATVEGTLDATSLRVEGQANTQASLVGLFVDLALGTGAARPDFMLEATALRVETDYADPVIQTTGGPVAYDADVMVDHYDDARVEGLQFQDQHEIQVVPMEHRQATIHTGDQCMTLEPSDSPSLVRPARVRADERPDLVVDTAHAAQWSGCDQSVVTITGDFLVVTWGHTAHLTTLGESATLQSGRMSSEQSPHPAADDAVYRHQQLYLYAEDAILTFSLVVDEYGLYLANASTQTEGGTVVLQDASGQLGVAGRDVALRGDRLAVTGDLGVHAAGAGINQALQVGVAGEAFGAHRNGELLPTGVVVEQAASGWLVLWSVLATMVAAVLVVWFVVPLRQYKHLRGDPFLVNREAQSVWHRHAAVYARHGRWALEDNKRLRAVVWTSMAVALHPTFTDYRVWRLGSTDKLQWRFLARWDHRRLDALLDNEFDLAENARLAMLLELRRGRHDAMQRWFEHAIEHHAGIVYKIQDDARFAAIHDEAWFQRAASRGAPWWPRFSLRLRQ